MAELKGSKTYQNLETAFAGESMARNKYTYFASQARKDGYVQIAEIFEETAENITEDFIQSKKYAKEHNQRNNNRERRGKVRPRNGRGNPTAIIKRRKPQQKRLVTSQTKQTKKICI